MGLIYREEKNFTPEELEKLILSVEWSSGKFPQKLVAAMRGYDFVYSARDEGRLAGLACAMDDGVMTAYVHYLLVLPEYQGRGIGRRLADAVREHYADYLKIVLVASPEKESFYSKLGYKVAGGTPMSLTEMED